MRRTNPANLNFCCLNINGRNKFTDFQEIISRNVDVVSIVETKIDASFPTAQFALEGYHSPQCLDISRRSGGILVYVKSPIPSRHLPCENLCDSIQAFPFEINLRKGKWLVISIYGTPSQNSEYFLNNIIVMLSFSLIQMIITWAIMGDNTNQNLKKGNAKN